MANLYATIGNEGTIWRPFLVKRVVNHVGENILVQEPELVRRTSLIRRETFKAVKEGLMAVVQDKEGTGKAANVPGQSIAGKTGTVQVISLGANRSRLAVSMNWREHAMFAAFSPVDNPEIAIAVVSEHDAVGHAGPPVAGKIFKAYYDLKAQREAQKTLSQRDPAGKDAKKR
jgi:penicillin-binding protein 2